MIYNFTYIFLRRTVVVLIGLHSHVRGLFQLNPHHGLICHGSVNRILLSVAVHCCSSLRKLPLLVR